MLYPIMPYTKQRRYETNVPDAYWQKKANNQP